jgi:hypothetical protein
MRQLKWKKNVGPISVGVLALGLAACDQGSPTPEEVDVSSTIADPTAAPTAAALPGENGTAGGVQDQRADAPSENPTGGRAAAPDRPQPSRPSAEPVASPTPEITRSEPKGEPPQAPDPHAGHDMQSMAGHDLEGM